MSDSDIICVDNVSMRFRLASEKVDSLKEYFIKTIKELNEYLLDYEVPTHGFI